MALNVRNNKAGSHSVKIRESIKRIAHFVPSRWVVSGFIISGNQGASANEAYLNIDFVRIYL